MTGALILVCSPYALTLGQVPAVAPRLTAHRVSTQFSAIECSPGEHPTVSQP